MIQHIVLFNPKPDLSDAKRRFFAQMVLHVLGRCQQISRSSVGRRVSVDPGYAREFGDKTYEYAAVLEFVDKDALVSYLTSADHSELGRLFWEMSDGSIVVEVEVASGGDALDSLV